MKKDNIKYLKDKKTTAVADLNHKKELSKNAQNPITSKFLAFRKTKKDIGLKDLL